MGRTALSSTSLLHLLPLFPLLTSAIRPPPLLPFSAPHLDESSANLSLPLDTRAILAPRDGNCPPTFLSCTALSPAYGAACCSSSAVCALDDAKNIACCPIGSKCTGIISASSPTVTSLPAESTVSNAYFPFPYAPTSFSDNAECAQYATACAQNFQACTMDLQGGYGVTIVVPGGGGVTVAPVQSVSGQSLNGGGVPVGEAESVCSSLSSVGCTGVSGGCSTWGSGAAATTTGGDGTDAFIVVETRTSENGARGVGGQRARETGFIGGMGMGVVAGVGLGVVGMM